MSWIRQFVRDPRLWLGGYLVALAGVALWSVRVDSGAGPFVREITRNVPMLTHARLEFAANVVMFVPFGFLLALILRRKHLVLPIALLCTVAIESAQDLFLSERIASTRDVIANLAGACIGILIAAGVEAARRASSRRRRARRQRAATKPRAALPHPPPAPAEARARRHSEAGREPVQLPYSGAKVASAPQRRG